MEFTNYTKELNNLAKKLQLENEIIEEIDIVTAIAYLNNIYIQNIGDCLIFLSALNLCNTYVKQTNSKIGYSFKKGIKYIIDIINNRTIDNIYIDCNQNNGTLILFQLGDIQFSFHDEKKVTINEKYLKELSWDGVKKQKCAKSIFYSAIQNEIEVTNITYRGKNLKDKVNKTLENYHQKKLPLKELMSLDI